VEPFGASELQAYQAEVLAKLKVGARRSDNRR
jgi:hypothetical protein